MNVIEHRLPLLTDAGWRGALTIFCSHLLFHRGEVWAHIDLDRRMIDAKKMLRTCGVMSSGEYGLVKVALSLFNTDTKLNLWEVLSGLDGRCTKTVIAAISNYCAYTGSGIELLHRELIEKALLETPVKKETVQS